MGIGDHEAEALGHESGYSPTILRRRLSQNPAVRTPLWTRQPGALRHLIPMLLVGAWHVQSNADCEILSLLSGTPYPDLEEQIAVLRTFDDSPIWSVGQFRGVASKKVSAIRSKHASVSRLLIHTGHGHPNCSAWITW